MFGWTIFILGLFALLFGALAQQIYVVPAIALSWWVTQYRAMKRVKEKRFILKRLDGLDHGEATRQIFA
jgi:hypothetical protein